MSQDRLHEDLRRLERALATHQVVRIVATPAESGHLDLEYRLPGLVRSPQGDIEVADSHLFRLTFVTGYPHFPPAVRPLTPLYHPDVDPDAVRISEAWERRPDLLALVRHLGRIVSGEHYDLEAPFDPEAAAAYREGRLPRPLPLAAMPEIREDAETDAPAGPEPLADQSASSPEKTGKKPEPSVSPDEIAAATGTGHHLPADEPDVVAEGTKPGRNRRLWPLLLAVLLLGGTGGGAYFWLDRRDQDRLARVRTLLAEMESDIQQQAFTRAKSSGEQALSLLAGVLVRRPEKSRLEEEITHALHSRVLQEGLAGRIYYQGRYLPREEVDDRRRLETLLAAIRSDGPQAEADTLRQAKELAAKLQQDELVQELDRRLTSQALAQAKQRLQDGWKAGNLDRAEQACLEALELARRLDDAEGARALEQWAVRIRFTKLRREAVEALKESRHQAAARAYQAAHDLCRNAPALTSAQECAALRGLGKKATLLGMLHAAEQKRAAGLDRQALADLEAASRYLERNAAAIPDAPALRRTIETRRFAIELARRRTALERAKTSGDPAAEAQAIEALLELLRTKEAGVQTTAEEIDADALRAELRRVRRTMFIEDKRRWLLAHVQEIFAEHYPLPSGARLEHPQAQLVEDSGGSLLFKLSCIQRPPGGQLLRLELFYRWSDAEGTWSLSPGPADGD